MQIKNKTLSEVNICESERVNNKMPSPGKCTDKHCVLIKENERALWVRYSKSAAFICALKCGAYSRAVNIYPCRGAWVKLPNVWYLKNFAVMTRSSRLYIRIYKYQIEEKYKPCVWWNIMGGMRQKRAAFWGILILFWHAFTFVFDVFIFSRSTVYCSQPCVDVVLIRTAFCSRILNLLFRTTVLLSCQAAFLLRPT